MCRMKDAAEGEAASVDNPQLKETFSRIAGFDKEIDSGELQDTLTTSLRTGECLQVCMCIYYVEDS